MQSRPNMESLTPRMLDAAMRGGQTGDTVLRITQWFLPFGRR